MTDYIREFVEIMTGRKPPVDARRIASLSRIVAQQLADGDGDVEVSICSREEAIAIAQQLAVSCLAGHKSFVFTRRHVAGHDGIVYTPATSQHKKGAGDRP